MTSMARTEKKPASIRHAEKRRTSTCIFADRVAQISVDHYKSTVPVHERPRQTCIATIVAHFSNDDDDDKDRDNLVVLSMGVGTKFLSEHCLRREEQDEKYGRRVRDMHAEVLARRAFRRLVTMEILDDLQGKSKAAKSYYYPCGRSTILIRSTLSSLSLPNTANDNIIRYQLRPGVTLHMYTSSAPCGNATLKKFGKMSKERFLDRLRPNEWPTTKHEPPPGHSIKLGEFALLIKKDNDRDTCYETTRHKQNSSEHLVSDSTSSDGRAQNEMSQSPSWQQLQKHKQQQLQQVSPSKRRGNTWPANESDEWTPPGTTIVSFRHKGSIHTCSDKICRWNYLGLQGSLLACFLEEPLYISTLTVGRKLSGSICRRAVCCRLDARSRPLVEPDSETITDNYRINHPAVLGTAVYLDETGVVETNSDVKGHDVRFHSSLSWAWWSGTSTCRDSTTTTNNNGTLECIDGSTGYLAKKHDGDDNTVSVAPQVSTHEFTKNFLQAYRLAVKGLESTHKLLPSDPGHDKTLTSNLQGLCQLKKECSPIYEQQKDSLLTKHRILCHWRRRVESRCHPS